MQYDDTIDDRLEKHSELVASLQTLLLGTHDLETFLNGVATMAAAVVEPPASCGITMPADGRPWTVASSDARARVVDQCQHESGMGPCIAAMSAGEPVEVRDQENDDRWPAYAEQVVALGVRCSLAVPLSLNGRTLGALTVHRYDRPRAFAPDERHRVEMFAAQATTAIALALQRSEQQHLAHHLEEALRSRAAIDQAIGALMAHERCRADAAFEMLRRHSQNSNRKLRDVAVDIVTRLTGHPPGDSVPFGADGRLARQGRS